MRLNGETRAVRISITLHFLLTLRPESPAILRRRETSLAQGVEIPKVPRSAALHQGDHLARYQIGKRIKSDSGPRKGGRRFGRLRHFGFKDILSRRPVGAPPPISNDAFKAYAELPSLTSLPPLCYFAGRAMAISDSTFDEPLVELRRQIEELEGFPPGSGQEKELERLRSTLRKETAEVYGHLNRWQRTLVARHQDRPYTLEYVEALMTEWVEIHGDRGFADDAAIVAGLAEFRGRNVAVIGHQKGRDTKERIYRNFGQPRPEGYRKALRVMKLAERFGLPVLTFIDTAGAYPGLDAEERGQAEAIARNLEEMAVLEVPIVVTITGEGGSGGALALGMGDRVYILEYATYSVISPEGCAAILWKDQEKKAEAAEAMKLTAPDLLALGVVDEIIPEPPGGAHTDPAATCRRVGDVIERALGELTRLPVQELIAQRYQKFRGLGAYDES
jgi:acetyl-CoA carboxylase carboxyl transferase subunit alpha